MFKIHICKTKWLRGCLGWRRGHANRVTVSPLKQSAELTVVLSTHTRGRYAHRRTLPFVDPLPAP